MSFTPSGRRKTRVALLFGGRSAEHAISCATAASVLRAIDRDRFDVVPIGIATDGRWVLAPDDPDQLAIRPGVALPQVPSDAPQTIVPLGSDDHELRAVAHPGEPPRSLGEVDVFFPLLHGPFGEDGTVQGMLEMAGARYVGCGVTASAVMMDKHYMKLVFASAGLPQVPYVVITDREWRTDAAACADAVASLGFPCFVKPARAGSSVGIGKVRSADELAAAVDEARRFDPKVIVEAAVTAREVECGVLQGHGTDAPRVSELGEIAVVGGHDFYDFEAKYLDADNVRLTCPADVPSDVRDEAREMALTAFEAAGCEGLARVDFFYTDRGELVLNEINTMPGFTPYSMFPQVWKAAGIEYRDLITELVELALERPLGLR